MTEAQRARVSQAHMGVHLSEEAKRKVSDFQKAFKHTKAHNRRVSLALRGKKFSRTHREALSKALTGRKLPEEVKQKLRMHRHTKAWKKRMSKIMRGRKLSEAAKAKISAAHKGKAVSPEHRARISATLKGRKRPDISKAVKASWTPAKRAAKSLLLKKLWAEGRAPSRKGRLLSQKHRDALSKGSQKSWNRKSSIPRRKATSERTKALWKDPTYRLKMSKRSHVLSLEARKAISEKLKGHPVSEEMRCKLAAASLKQWKARSATEKVVFMKRMRRAAAVRETSIERSVQICLTKLKVPFLIHKRIGPYTADIYLATHKAVIECDGDYWHNTSSAKVHDTKRDAWMAKRKLTVIRLKEKDIRKNVLRCVRAALRKFIPDALTMNRK